MKSVIGMAISVAMAGCASAPQVITQTKTVEVPIAVPCRSPVVVRPAWALDRVDPGADLYTKGRAALAELEQRAGYEALLEAALLSCR